MLNLSSEQFCLTSSKRTGQFKTKQHIRNIFWHHTVQCFMNQQQHCEVGALTNRKSVLRSEKTAEADLSRLPLSAGVSCADSSVDMLYSTVRHSTVQRRVQNGADKCVNVYLSISPAEIL